MRFGDPFVAVDSFCAAFGIGWRAGQVWIAPGSSLNPSPRAPARLLDAYETMLPLPPTPEDVAVILAELEPKVPEEELGQFVIESAMLRASAKEYYAL